MFAPGAKARTISRGRELGPALLLVALIPVQHRGRAAARLEVQTIFAAHAAAHAVAHARVLRAQLRVLRLQDFYLALQAVKGALTPQELSDIQDRSLSAPASSS